MTIMNVLFGLKEELTRVSLQAWCTFLRASKKSVLKKISKRKTNRYLGGKLSILFPLTYQILKDNFSFSDFYIANSLPLLFCEKKKLYPPRFPPPRAGAEIWVGKAFSSHKIIWVYRFVSWKSGVGKVFLRMISREKSKIVVGFDETKITFPLRFQSRENCQDLVSTRRKNVVSFDFN